MMGEDPLAVVGMNAAAPGPVMKVDLLFSAETADEPPHARIEDPAREKVMVPNALAGCFQGRIPTALGLDEVGLGALAPSMSMAWIVRWLGVPGHFIDQRRREARTQMGSPFLCRYRRSAR